MAADLRRLRNFSEQQGITFGVITANRTFTDTDERKLPSTTQWAPGGQGGAGMTEAHHPPELWGLTASGFREVPINLPEDDPSVHSHTRLILEILSSFD